MCEQTEINYLVGEVVWVKLGSCWWPGEVVSLEALPPDVARSFRKPPIAVVKFFLEDTYEYVKNINSIYKYNCSRKDEFIKKGLYMYRTKHGHMEKFPEDVIRAETAVGGDIEILKRDEFQETKKESYAGIFGDSKKTPASAKKGKNGRGRPQAESPIISRPFRKMKEKTDYKVHILVQGSKAPNEQTPEALPSTSSASNDLSTTENKTQDESTPLNDDKHDESVNEKHDTIVTSPTPLTSIPMPSTPAPATPRAVPSTTPKVVSSAGIYACHACPFTTTRLNVLILHNKTHSVTYMPYTPSPVRKKVVPKSPPKTPKTPKPRKPRKEKSETKKVQAKKRTSQEVAAVEVKKPKTDEEIKSSLLADWDDDDIEDESNDESSAMVSAQSPEVPVGSESPAVPTPAELPSAEVPSEICTVPDKKTNSSPSTEKPESSKYEFCEDEDWPEEADIGRKIPRVKNPIRTDETKSVSIDEDEVAREVAELLNKTAVPELPSVPEPLKIEENFPERSIVKSPDKKEDPEKSPDKPIEKTVTDPAPSKVIFKTKTFFRSRHSRSQDAIGKYVAEQLNAVEKMDIAENEINGSEAASSPEARDSPPIEPVKVARLAPKIQLKKMKAEAAQLREKEKMYIDKAMEMVDVDQSNAFILESKKSVVSLPEPVIPEPNHSELPAPSSLQDVVYPSEVIKPVNEEIGSYISGKREKQSNIDTISTVEKEETSKKEVIVGYDESEVRKLDDAAILADTYVEEPTKLAIGNSHENSQESEVQDNNLSVTKLLVQSLPNNEKNSTDLPTESSEHGQIGPYMNESTASAVDALLSVAREPDRVPKVISNDLPEDLFEDDNKDSEITEVSNSELKKNMPSNILTENCLEQPLEDHVERIPEHVSEIAETNDEVQHNEVVINDAESSTVVDTPEIPENNVQEPNAIETSINDEPMENIPSESDLQIAEALINLPATAIQGNPNEVEENVTIPFNNIQEVPVSENVVINESEIPMQDNEIIESEQVNDTDILNSRFETDHEKSENLNAAQSLVQMSEFIEHKTLPKQLEMDSKKIADSGVNIAKQNNGIESSVNLVEQNISISSSDIQSEQAKTKSITYEQTSSKLLKILEEPVKTKLTAIKTTTVSTTANQIMKGKDKILNFDVAKSTPFKSKTTPKQKIIIRRTGTPTGANKTVLNNVSELAGSDKILLSRSGNPTQDGSAVQTFTIQTSPDQPSDANTIIIQQKIRKISKPTIIQPKLQKIKPQTSLVTSVNEMKTITQPHATDDAMFDINSMPIVLSEDLLTPESIEKMPVVMSDANIISQSQSTTKVIKPKPNIIEHEKVAISPTPHKQELKTLLLNPVSEVTKSVTPNILSKSSKLRGAKPMLVIDKTTGKQKLIMTKTEPIIKEVKHAPTLIQSTQQAGKSEKFLILPTQSPTPRPTRTQKIVIDPQTGKAHVFVAKGSDTPISTENKPVSAKLVPSNSDASAPGNTVMIITNAQGAQSRIVLTPEHEKILFPNKQQPKVSQLKTVTHRITSAAAQKSVTNIAPVKTHSLAPVKTTAKSPARIVPKPKSAIITSKGQLIVGGRVATTAQNIAPMPELRPVTKRIITSEPKKLIQKSTSEPIIFLQQKSGAMMQLTASQFEHMQRTGQIIQQKVTTAPVQEKIVIQKVKSSNDPGSSFKPRARKTISDSPTPSKKIKHEIAIAPAPLPSAVPALAPAAAAPPPALVPAHSNNAPAPSTSNFSEFENFEELLPSTAIVRHPEPSPAPEPEPAPAPAPAAPLSDGQLLAVPGEHFGGPVGTFYLCVEDNGTYTPIDNRPLVLENNQLVPMNEAPPPPQPERRDILEAALANSDVFHADATRDDAPDFRDLNANVSVHCRVSETSTTLNQPIMTPVEQLPSGRAAELAVHSSMEDGLAVIGVTPHAVPTSLELPITVTDPRIAPKTTDPLGGNKYGAPLLSGEPYVGAEVISMPLLAAEDAVGKSMPLLSEERSPASEPEDWARRSDCSDEIPLQPHLQLSAADLHSAS